MSEKTSEPPWWERSSEERQREAVRRIEVASETNATSLELNNLSLERLPDELGKLTALTSLVLRGNWQVAEFQQLSTLTALTSLDLDGCGSLIDLQPLSKLTALTSLNLFGCREVTDLRPLTTLTALTELTLFGCRKISDLSPLISLASLVFLDLDSCKGVKTFSPCRKILSQLSTLYITNCQFEDLPTALCGIGYNENVIGKVIAHYADLDHAATADAERKILILGNGTVGKTQLARRLQGLPFDPTIPTTHGIELGQMTVMLAADVPPVTLNLWDFGGQDVYHGAHSLFLQDDAVYVLLWHPDHETGDVSIPGVTMHNRPLGYWLDFIRSLAGPNSPVLIVQSQCDTPSQRIATLPASTNGFTYFRQLHCSAATDVGLEVLQAEIKDAVRKLVADKALMPIGAGRVKVRDHLRKMLTKDQERLPVERKHRTLTVPQFRKVCKKFEGVSDPDALLDFLHHTGVVYYKPGLMADRIVLDQNWALEAIYALFHREKTLPTLRKLEGRFTRSDLASLIWQDYSVEEQNVFLDVMVGCGICFKTREVSVIEGHKEAEYIAPELLPESPERKALVLSHLPPTPDAAAELRYTFLHEGILRGLLSRLGRDAAEQGVFWKYGCWFYESKTQSELVLDRVPATTDAGPYAGTVSLRAWGPKAAELIDRVLQIILDQRMGQSPEIVRPESEPPHMLELPAGPVEPLQITALPGPVVKEKQEVFISYAWGDDRTDAGRQRALAVERLTEKLTEWGYRPIRDIHEMRSGDLISTFMKRLSAGDRILVILSDKYLQSEYCITELHNIFVQARHDKAEFLQRIVPVTMDDARIGTIRERITHAKRWQQSVDDIKSDLDYLGPADHARYFLQKRWCTDIGEMLAYISDELHPHGWDQIAANDFHEVHELLQRPLGTTTGGSSKPG